MTAPLSMSVADWEQLIHACIAQGDTTGVGHVLRLMAIDKPHEASDMLGFLNTALRSADRA